VKNGFFRKRLAKLERAVNESGGKYFGDLLDPRPEQTQNHEMLNILFLAIIPLQKVLAAYFILAMVLV
jgi:hypothetical protein